MKRFKGAFYCLFLILISNVIHETHCFRGRRHAEKEEQSDDSNTQNLDIGKLLSSGKPLSIKSKETDTLDEKGNTEKRIKEIEIGTLGSNKEKDSSANAKEGGGSPMDSLVSALKTGLSNASLTNVNSPLSGATGALSQYPSINELSKEPYGNQSVSAQAPVNQTSESALSEASHNPSNQSHAETDSTAPDASHLTSNESSSVSSESLPAASAEGGQPQSSNNQSSAEVTGDSAKASTGGNQIALVPVSLPQSLISQLTGSLNNNASAAVNSENTTSSSSTPAAAALTSQNNTESNGNETMGLRRDSSLLGNADVNRLLTGNQKVEQGNGEGVIFLTKIMSNAPVKEKSNPEEGFKRYDIDLTYEEEPDDDDEEDDDNVD